MFIISITFLICTQSYWIGHFSSQKKKKASFFKYKNKVYLHIFFNLAAEYFLARKDGVVYTIHILPKKLDTLNDVILLV